MMKSTKFGTAFVSILILMIFTTPLKAIDTLGVEGGANNPKDLPAIYFDKLTGISSSVARVIAVDKGTNGIKFNDPYNSGRVFNAWAGTFRGTINSQNTNFYCIDISHNLAFYTTQQPHQYIDSGSTPSQITYVLMNYYPYKAYPYPGALNTVQKEAAAIQLAIWHFADGVDANSIQNSELKNRTLAIIADANQNANGFVPVKTLLIIPTASQYFAGSPAQFRVRVFDELARPVANRQITLVASGGTLSQTTVTTDATGISPLITLNPGGQQISQ